MKSTAAASSAVPMPIWTYRRGKRATKPAPSHAPTTAARISKSSVLRLDGNDADEDRGLDDGWKGVADVERPRNSFVGNEAEQLKQRGRRRERTDAQRIEEVRDETDRDADRGANRLGQRRTVARHRTNQRNDHGNRYHDQAGEKERVDRHRQTRTPTTPRRLLGACWTS